MSILSYIYIRNSKVVYSVMQFITVACKWYVLEVKNDKRTIILKMKNNLFQKCINWQHRAVPQSKYLR